MAETVQYLLVYSAAGLAVALVYKSSRTFQLSLTITAALGIWLIGLVGERLDPTLSVGVVSVVALGIGVLAAAVSLRTTNLPALHGDAFAIVEIAAFAIAASFFNIGTSHQLVDARLPSTLTLTTPLIATLGIALLALTLWVRDARLSMQMELLFADPVFAAANGVPRAALTYKSFALAYVLFFAGAVVFAIPRSTQIRLHSLLELHVLGLAIGSFVDFRLHFIWLPALAVGLLQVFVFTYVVALPSTATPIVVFAALLMAILVRRTRHTITPLRLVSS